MLLPVLPVESSGFCADALLGTTRQLSARTVATSGRQATLSRCEWLRGRGGLDLEALLHSLFLRRGAGCPAELSLKS
jgi:hypothetical protein